MTDIDITLQELFDLQKFAIKLGLHNISALSKHFDNPHLSYPTIHIAGTNGKGSTAIILQQILMSHGLKTALYTSPHLFKFNERIRVNNQLIEDQFIIDFWHTIKDVVLNMKATFFDTTTCLAFEYFKQKQVDVAIFETGLGGRLDSTNIIHPELAIITPIDFDHQKQLGHTLQKIASEKAGIIKQDHPVFLAKQQREVLDFFTTRVKSNNLLYFDNLIDKLIVKTDTDQTEFGFFDTKRNLNFNQLKLNLLGSHQAENACLSYSAARHYLENVNLTFNSENFKKVLSTVTWFGRLQKLTESPKIYFDVSHNTSGFKKSIEYIQSKFIKNDSKLIIGLLEDKDFEEIVKIVKDVFSEFWIVEPNNPRKLAAQTLINEFAKYKISARFIKDISDSFESIINSLSQQDSVFIMGSHFLAEQIRELKSQNNLT